MNVRKERLNLIKNTSFSSVVPDAKVSNTFILDLYFSSRTLKSMFCCTSISPDCVRYDNVNEKVIVKT